MNKTFARLMIIATSWLALGAVGCVERRFVITSSPPGAIVMDENNNPLGAAPVDHPFTYYGKYRFRLVKDGYETLVVEERVKAPFYEWPIIDFFSENVIPWTFRDVRRFEYAMKPLQIVPPEILMQNATQLRERGKGIALPLPTDPKTPAPLPGPVAN